MSKILALRMFNFPACLCKDGTAEWIYWCKSSYIFRSYARHTDEEDKWGVWQQVYCTVYFSDDTILIMRTRFLDKLFIKTSPFTRSWYLTTWRRIGSQYWVWANYTLNYSDFVFYTEDIAILGRLPDTEISGSKNTAADGPVTGDNQKKSFSQILCALYCIIGLLVVLIVVLATVILIALFLRLQTN